MGVKVPTLNKKKKPIDEGPDYYFEYKRYFFGFIEVAFEEVEAHGFKRNIPIAACFFDKWAISKRFGNFKV